MSDEKIVEKPEFAMNVEIAEELKVDAMKIAEGIKGLKLSAIEIAGTIISEEEIVRVVTKPIIDHSSAGSETNAGARIRGKLVINVNVTKDISVS